MAESAPRTASKPFGKRRRRTAARRHFEPLEDRTLLSTFHVSFLNGDDALGDGSAANPFRSVQKGIDVASALLDGADEVKVEAGTYNTAAVDLAITIPASANLTNLELSGGWDQGSTFTTRTPRTAVYVPQQAGNVNFADVDVFDDDVTIDGFTFVFDGTAGPGGSRQSAGIISRGMNLSVTDNTIEVGSGSAAADAYGLQTLFNSNQGNLAITGSTFDASSDPGFRSGGIYLNPGTATAITVSNNTVSGSNLFQGIVADSISNVTISGNTLFRTGPADAQFQQFIFAGPFNGSADQSNILIENNLINRSSDGGVLTANSVGIEIGHSSGNGQTLLDVTVNGNVVENNAVGILANVEVASATIRSNSITGNTIGLVRVDEAVPVVINAAGNWWGDASGPTVASNPGGTGQSIFGWDGTMLVAATQVDHSPWLSAGTDKAPGSTGFQGDFSQLTVNPGSPRHAGQVAGGVFNFQEGIDETTAGGTLLAAKGTYDLAGSPSAAAAVDIGKALTLQAADFVDGTPDNTTTILQGVLSKPIDVRITSPSVSIEGFTFDFNGAGTRNVGGIEANGNPNLTNIHILNNVIELPDADPNFAFGDYGFRTGGPHNFGGLQINGNSFLANGDNGGLGIFLNPDAAGSPGSKQVNANTFSGKLIQGINVDAMGGVTIDGNQLDTTLTTALADNPKMIRVMPFSGQTFSDIAITNNLIGTAGPSIGGRQGIIIGASSGNVTNVTVSGNEVAGTSLAGIRQFNADVLYQGNTVRDNPTGMEIAGGRAIIENNDLSGNTTGIQVRDGALVDAGDLDIDGTSFTGLTTGSGDGGSSAGNNALTGYTGTTTVAIDNQNLVGSGHPIVKAEKNDFGPTVLERLIEDYIVDDTDNAALTLIDFSPVDNLQPSVAAVYVDDDWVGIPLGADPDGGGPATVFGVDAFKRVDDGADGVLAGGTVNVFPGTYLEQVSIAKAQTLRGASGIATDVVIDPPSGAGINVAASSVTIESLRVTGASDGITANGVSGLTLKNVQSDSNTLDGVNATNLTGVTVSGGNYSDNGGDGIFLTGLTGTATLTNVTADVNGGQGLDIDGGFAAVTISGGSYSGNGLDGIEIVLVPTVSLTGVVANNNTAGGGDGVAISSATTVSIADGLFAGNGGDGVQIDLVSGTVSFSNVTASNNAGDGINVDNVGGTVSVSGVTAGTNGEHGFQGNAIAGSVTISGSTFSDNAQSVAGGDGIHLTAVGAVMLTTVTSTGNGTGVFIEDAASLAVTMGTNSSNSSHGVQLIDVAGDVTLVRTTADNNDADNNGIGDGLNVSASANPVAIGGNLLVQGARFRDSGGAGDHQELGVFVASISGSVTFEDSAGPAQSVAVTGNEGGGVVIADGGTTATFTNGTYSSNGDDGIFLNSFSGTVTLTNVTAGNNAGFGFQATNVATSVVLSDLALQGNSTAGGNIDTVPIVDFTTTTGSVADTVTVRSDRFQHNRAGSQQDAIRYANVSTLLEINTLGGSDTVNVESTTAATASTVVNAGDADDRVNVGGGMGIVDSVAGTLTVNGEAGADTLGVDDSANAAGKTTLVTKNTVTLIAPATIHYDSIAALEMFNGNGNDAVTVLVPNEAGAESLLPGSFRLDGGPAGSDTLLVQGAATLASNVFAGASGSGVQFENDDYEQVTLRGGTQDDLLLGAGKPPADRVTYTFQCGGNPPGSPDFVFAKPGDNTTGCPGAIILGVTDPNLIKVGNDNANTLVATDPRGEFLIGRGGNDTLLGGPGPDILLGGLGDDLLEGGERNDALIGGAGNDRLFGGFQSGTLEQTQPQTTLSTASAAGATQLQVAAFIPMGTEITINPGSATQERRVVTLVNGATAPFTVTLNAPLGVGHALGEVVRFQSGGDFLEGGTGNDTLDGGAGNDVVVDLFAGNDTLIGGPETVPAGTLDDDTLAGGPGNDSLRGGAGNDVLVDAILLQISIINLETSGDPVFLAYTAGGGNDTMLGGAGNDRINGGPGNDQLRGGDGNDLVVDVHATFNVPTGAPLFNPDGTLAERPADTVEGVEVTPRPDQGGDDDLDGGEGNDTLAGGTGLDLVQGGNGDDILMGSILADEHLFASGLIPGGPFNQHWDGTDTLNGGAGTDWLIDVSDSRGIHNDGSANVFQGGEVVITQFTAATLQFLTHVPNHERIFGTFVLVDFANETPNCGGFTDCVERFTSGLGAFLQGFVGINPPSSTSKGRSARPSPASTPITVSVPNEQAARDFLGAVLEGAEEPKAVFRAGRWFFDFDRLGGIAEDSVGFGLPGDVPVLGDFGRVQPGQPTTVFQRLADAVEDLAVFRGGMWFFDVDGKGGAAERAFAFGLPGDVPVVGDWNGDRVSEVAVFRNGMWFFDLDGNGGAAEQAFAFGLPGDVPVVGDFNGDNKVDIGVFRNGVWFIDTGFNGGVADLTIGFGMPGDRPVIGDWNGDGRDDLGVVRGARWFLDLDGVGGAGEKAFNFGIPGDVALAGNWSRRFIGRQQLSGSAASVASTALFAPLAANTGTASSNVAGQQLVLDAPDVLNPQPLASNDSEDPSLTDAALLEVLGELFPAD